MSSKLALLLWMAFTAWLLWRDAKTRPRLSAATWLPTIWLMILASRPVSLWLGNASGANSAEKALDGNPMDRMFFLAMMVASFMVLQQRQLKWGEVFRDNQVLVALYVYFLMSVLWAETPFSSFKRLTKDFGNVLMILVILSETNPQEAIRAMFARCAYVLIPASILVVRYFPDIGRFYSPHDGRIQPIGVATQKNSLGALVLVTGLILVWEIVRELRSERPRKLDLCMRGSVLLLGLWLFKMSDSKTALMCFAVGSALIASSGIGFVRRNASKLMVYGTVAAATVFCADKAFGITRQVVESLGRDMTFTGRTEIWDELLRLKTNPLLGTGFYNFWTDGGYLEQLPEWIAFGRSAHNGYLEMYLDGGLIGLALIIMLLLLFGRRIHRSIGRGDEWAFLRLAVFAVTVVYSFSESTFGRLTPIWFVCLLAAIEYKHRQQRTATAPNVITVEAQPVPAKS